MCSAAELVADAGTWSEEGKESEGATAGSGKSAGSPVWWRAVVARKSVESETSLFGLCENVINEKRK